MSRRTWHNIDSPHCSSDEFEEDEEMDIYEAMLLKSYRSTSSAERAAQVAAKLAALSTGASRSALLTDSSPSHQNADHVLAENSTTTNSNRAVVTPEIASEDANTPECQQQQQQLEVTINAVMVTSAADQDDIKLLSSTSAGLGWRKTKKAPLTPEKANKLEAKRQRRMARQRSRPAVRTYWNAISVDLIERIFRLLSVKERHIASQVCPHWFECFYSPYIWSLFVVNDFTFTKRKFNYYLGYQRVVCPFKTQAFLKRFGHTIRSLVICPMSSFYNLFEIMAIMESYSLHYEENPLVLLSTFDFTFGCQYSNGETANDLNNNAGYVVQANRRGSLAQGQGQLNDGLIGTGGKILEALQSLMGQLIGLKHLALRNLFLMPFEAQYLLDNVALNCCERLHSLTLINCSSRPYAFLHTGIFLNLETLIISCSHLSDDVLTLLADTKLRQLYIVQNEYTKTYEPLQPGTWKRFVKNCDGRVEIHLALTHSPGCMDGERVDASEKKLIHDPAPVSSVIYDTAYIPMRSAKLLDIIELYSESLNCLAFYQLPKFPILRSYSQRADAELIRLSETCAKLSTLIIRELISTSTLLIIVSYARNLTRLYIRRNALRKRFDCVRNPQWSEAFVDWLKRTSRSYEDTFTEVSQKLGYRWEPLSDQQFKKLKPDVHF